MSQPRPQTPRRLFPTALADWQRAWTDYTRHDRRAATAGFATPTGRAHLAVMSDIATRIATIETQIAQTQAHNRAELIIKITILSIDGTIRPEFQSAILDDAMRMITKADARCRSQFRPIPSLPTATHDRQEKIRHKSRIILAIDASSGAGD